MKHLICPLPVLRSICLPCRQKLIRSSLAQKSFPIHARPLSTTISNRADNSTSLDDLDLNFPSPLKKQKYSLTPEAPLPPHRLHIYATKHNCHITLTRGNRDALISVSSGNIGFKKAQRGTYDAAYQLSTFVLGKINNQGLLSPEYPGKGGPINELEVVLRDYGPGREAVTKLLLGSEGRALRGKISRVMDATRLKFGGTRSPKPRRLG